MLGFGCEFQLWWQGRSARGGTGVACTNLVAASADNLEYISRARMNNHSLLVNFSLLLWQRLNNLHTCAGRLIMSRHTSTQASQQM